MTVAEERAIALLTQAEEVIGMLHALLPDDGKEHGTAPSWWHEGTAANLLRAAIQNYLREQDAS